MNEQTNLGIVSDMKQEVLKVLLSDEDTMKLVMDAGIVTLPAMAARYTQVYPWKQIPDTQEEAKVLITYDVLMGKAANPAARTYTLFVWVICPESLMVIDSKKGKELGIPDRGARTDILADKVDYLLNGSTELGFGKLEIQRSEPFTPIAGYYGRYLQYSILGWNRHGDKL